VTIEHFTSLALVAVLLGLWIAERIARRQADNQIAVTRSQLVDAIAVQVEKCQENQMLRNSLELALQERNAANLRAQRAINSIRALPAINIRCKLPTDATGVTNFNLN
jgi:hypothetical protein